MSAFRKNRYLVITVILILMISYFSIFFSHGYWHNDVFLHKTGEGTFKSITGYVLEIHKTESQADITFTAGGITKQYQVISESSTNILEDGELIYSGIPVWDGTRYYLKDGAGSLLLSESERESVDAFPSRTELLNWALLEKAAVRGNPVFLIFLGMTAVSLILSYLDFFRDSKTTKPLRWVLMGCILFIAVLSLVTR